MKTKHFLVCLAMLLLSMTARAQETWECGYPNAANVTATLSNGTLTISGTGNMQDFSIWNSAPWRSSISDITTVVIQDGVASIGEWAFWDCSGLTSVTISDGVTNIGSAAFESCSGLTSVTIPDGVTSIEEAVFWGCSGLTSVTIPDGVTSIGDAVFSGCSGLTSVTIPNGVTSIGGEAFGGCRGLTSVTIPNGVTSINHYAFYGCSGLTSVTIPNGVTSINYYAFYGCSGLTSVTIPNSVTSIGDCAFYGCSGLTSVTIPNSVTSIGDGAFEDCSGLTSVTIGNAVTSIGVSAFSGCSSLTSVINLSPMPQGISSDEFKFVNLSQDTLYVPASSLDLYLAAEVWKNFNDIVALTLVTGVSLNKTTATLQINGTAQLTATIAPANADNKTVTWSSSNSAIATVSESGLVIGKAAGTATITVTTTDGNNTASCTVTVHMLVTGVSLNKITATLQVNGTAQLTATIAPTNATNKNVTWSSSNSAIATVSESGLVIGKAAGTATITVTTTDGNKTASCTVTVQMPVTGVSLNKTTATLQVNGTAQLTATIAPTNATNKNVAWSSNNSAIATVSESGLVTGKAAGTATITVTTTDGNRTAYCTLTVTAADTPGNGDTPDTDNPSTAVNATGTVALCVYPNPTTGTVRIEGLEDIAGATEVQVYSASSGTFLLRTHQSTIDLSAYPNGIYLLRVGSKTLKVVKE